MPDRTPHSAGATRAEWAVLSDMDGTLLDTESTWLLVVEEFVRRHSGADDPALVSTLRGLDLDHAAATLRSRLSLEMTTAAVAEELDRRSIEAYDGGVSWTPGARSLLTALAAAQVPLALVTSSPRHWVERFAQAVDLSAFDVIVTADDTPRTKPAPDPYLRAAERLDVAAHRCVALEDSLVGATSAVAAGCTTLVVGSGKPVPDTLQVGSLIAVDVRMLRAVARGSMPS
ncbi:HAD family phosphatase [Microbacterium sp. APC 3901]|uniref:HAD family hydrolase n=1 Tax=Microbacterium sp. APC 3901 TaxID=3035192 RepID=UPI0025B5790E|nr:HAD family phosphatase [Microbacterium sp. APC 3901]MDN3442721.1 HAD family phosphatase [Microbacterium sp. APC 3901]